jgi:hypothetical protein
VRGGAGEKWIKGEMRTRQHRQRGAVRREYAPPMRGPEGRVRGDGKGDQAAEEIDSDDDGSRGDEGSRGESEKEMAEETERWGRPAAATMDLEGKYKRISGGDEASEVS